MNSTDPAGESAIMLKEIIEAFHGEGQVSDLLCAFDGMLDHCGRMYSLTNPSTVSSADMNNLFEEIYALDRQVNETERRIRYQILGLLNEFPGRDVTLCMMLMVVCKDAERIGDYCKNIFEVLLYCGPSRYASVHVGEFQNIRDRVGEMMSKSRQAFCEGNIIAAQSIIAAAGELSRSTDFVVQQILEGHAADVSEPAGQVLLARHYKRVSSHLSNICTAVTSPVEMLGYYDERRMRPQNDTRHEENPQQSG